MSLKDKKNRFICQDDIWLLYHFSSYLFLFSHYQFHVQRLLKQDFKLVKHPQLHL